MITPFITVCNNLFWGYSNIVTFLHSFKSNACEKKLNSEASVLICKPILYECATPNGKESLPKSLILPDL